MNCLVATDVGPAPTSATSGQGLGFVTLDLSKTQYFNIDIAHRSVCDSER